MNDAVNFVNHAATQSDRWLFLAAIALMTIFAGIVIRYLVAWIKEQHGQLGQIYKETNEARVEMGKIVQRNSDSHDAHAEAMREHTQVMQRVIHRLDKEKA